MEKPQMLSSVEGRIKELLVILPGIPTEMSLQEYENIVKLFDPQGTVYRFLLEVPGFSFRSGHWQTRGPYGAGWETDTGQEGNYRYVENIHPRFDLQRLIKSWETELIELQSGSDLYYQRWAQDPFVTLAWNGATVLLKSHFNTRMCDFFLPFELSLRPDDLIFVKPTELYLEGGNLLRGLNGVFVGAETIAKNRDDMKRTEEEVIEDLAAVLGVEEIFVVGNPGARPLTPERRLMYRDGGDLSGPRQPIFHIDMFMNLGGRSKDGKREIVFLANPGLNEGLLRGGSHDRLSRLISDLPNDDPFQSIRDGFDASRFEVIDVPIYHRNKVWYSWNNCLTEVSGEERHVFLPSFLCREEDDREQMNPAFELLQAKVARIYREQDFQVHWIEDGRFFRKIAKWQGGLHCITKVIRRV